MVGPRAEWLLTLVGIVVAANVQAQPTLQWARCYDGPANGWDAAGAIAVDDSGNVYVTGGSTGIGTDYDYVTLKYNASGQLQWLQRYNGPENGFDAGRDIAVDDSGNVYVTGTSVAGTIKYDRFGNQRWLRRFGQFSAGYRIRLRAISNVVVAGVSQANFMVLNYDTEGNLLWESGYNGPANDLDRINDMALDSQGNVIVTGQSWGIGTQWDYATVKYSGNGDTLWVRRYNGPAQDVPTDQAYAITVDDSNNVYVTGWSDGITERPQCLTIKYSPNGDPLWERRFPTGGTVGYAGYDILFDRGFIYIVARANGFDDTLLKYDSQGTLIWSRAYRSNHTFATNPPRLAVDTAGNIYVTSVTSVGRSDFVVLKYAPDGTRLWQYAYPDSGTNTGNEVYALAVDKTGNVYLTGASSGWVCPGAGYDYLTLKLSQGTTEVPSPQHIPTRYALHQNYPNPFNPSTIISFSLPLRSFVSLKVFDLLGRDVATIVSEELPAGKYSREWFVDGLPSGVYFYRIQAGEFSETRKLIVLR